MFSTAQQTIGIALLSLIFSLCMTVSVCAEERLPFIEFNHSGRTYTVTCRQLSPVSFLYNPGAAKKIRMVTLDWPPYIGKQICSQGWVQQFTIALLAMQGYEITTDFLPWARAISMAETGKADVLYPEYFIEEAAPSDVIEGTRRRDHLALSKPFPGGRIALIKRKGAPSRFNGDLKSLKEEKIGVVRGYQNTPEFDALMDAGFFDISSAVDDLSNVSKLIGGRVNLIIGDPLVIFYHLSAAGPASAGNEQWAAKIEIIEPVLQYNHLYFAVSTRAPDYEIILDDLNRGIDELTSSGFLNRLIRSVTTRCKGASQ
jgi:polar amino acid transport system substrate-binding protein